MRFLVVNDDGINAQGIKLLAKWALQYGEVTVVAPKHEQSGKSHAIDFINPIDSGGHKVVHRGKVKKYGLG